MQFLFSTSRNWNEIFDKVFVQCKSQENGIVIPGSSINSDLSASIGFVKQKVKSSLLKKQNDGDPINWC